MGVEIMCKNLVKPAKETWNGILPLSELDQVFDITHFSHLYFYSKPTKEWLNPSNNKILDTLKHSLSHALVPFYPLAGRLRWIGGGRLELECNAMGAELIEIESDKRLSDFGEFYSCGSMFQDLLTPMNYYEKDISEFPVLSVQVTRFKCGGLCLGTSVSHVVADGPSAFHFTKEWARLALGKPLKVAPFLDRRVLGAQTIDRSFVDKSSNKVNYFSELRLSQEERWGKQLDPTFVKLTKDQIDQLKKTANNVEAIESDTNSRRPYSRFEVLAAHVWRSICMARELKSDDVTSFMTVVNVRGRMESSLPLSYFGNAIVDVECSSIVGDLISNPLSYGCGKVREAVEKVTSKYVFDNIENFRKQRCLRKYQFIDDRGIVEGPSYGDQNVLVVSWLNLPGQGNDFGWGTEVHFGPPIVQACDGDIQISPYSDDGSVVVRACLDQKENYIKSMGFTKAHHFNRIGH